MMTKLLLVALTIGLGTLFYTSFGNFSMPPPRGMIQQQTTPKPSFKTLTLDKIFGNNHLVLVPEDQKIILIATGDVIPVRDTNSEATLKNDFLWPYVKVADEVKKGDITFINLETPLLKNCPLTREGFKFCGDAKHIEGLKLIGTDVASLANNHSWNYGEEGINETVKILNENGVTPTGINGAVVMVVKGIKFAFLGYNDIGFTPDYISGAIKEKIQSEITDAKKNADVVIVTYHWGAEYQSQPDLRQKSLGHFTIDAGADLVIGNHPHWIQPVELYQGKLITYAHGNFVFDQEWSQKTKEGVVGRYTFYGKDLVDVEYLPLEIIDYGQPYFLEGNAKQAILDEMRKQSEILASNSAEPQ